MMIRSILITALTILTASCDKELDINNIGESGEGDNLLTISGIITHNSTKALIEDDYLPNGSEIGVTVLKSSGAAYDDIDYQNIRFVATGSGAEQTWAGDETVYLSATEGVCYGSYPYSSSVTDITQIPVSTAGQVDYLYASPVAVDINNRDVSLTMNHGLSAVRLAIKRGTYTGTGKITAVSVTSSGLGPTGTLNATTGKVTANGISTAIAVTTNIDLTTTEENADIIVVPTGTSAALTLSVTVDGKVYSTAADPRIIAQGKCYTYTMTINAGELALSGVTVGDWGYDDGGAPTIEAAGYKVTFAGDYSDISFSNSVNGATVKIVAQNKDQWPVKAVSISGDAILAQTESGNVRTINLLAVNSDVIVTFNGVDNPWNDLPDGVYGVSADLRPVAAEDATSDCIAVALINTDTGQKLMIEKYEYANASYQAVYVDNGFTSTGSNNYKFFNWGVTGYTMNSLLNISDYPSYTMVNSLYSYGGIPYKDGTILSSYNNLGLPSTWPTDDTKYCLADKSGYHHSQYLMQVTITDDYKDFPKMSCLLKTFLNSPDALGFTNWYIPSFGQLCLFCVYLLDLNSILETIGGTPIDERRYWSSSEKDESIAWFVGLNFTYRDVNSYSKYAGYNVRFVRDL